MLCAFEAAARSGTRVAVCGGWRILVARERGKRVCCRRTCSFCAAAAERRGRRAGLSPGVTAAPFPSPQFLADVEAVAAMLPAARQAVNLCEDRYAFLVAFCAVVVPRTDEPAAAFARAARDRGSAGDASRQLRARRTRARWHLRALRSASHSQRRRRRAATSRCPRSTASRSSRSVSRRAARASRRRIRKHGRACRRAARTTRARSAKRSASSPALSRTSSRPCRRSTCTVSSFRCCCRCSARSPCTAASRSFRPTSPPRSPKCRRRACS